MLVDWKHSKESPTQEGMGRRSAGLLLSTLLLLMASTLFASSQAP